MFRSDLDEAGDALGRVERPVHPFRKRGDLPGAYTNRVEGKDDFGKFQRGPLPIERDLRMEIAFSDTRNFEILQGPARVRRSQM